MQKPAWRILNTSYFSVGINDENDGLYGAIAPTDGLYGDEE